MRKNKIFVRIQQIFGISEGELIVAILLVSGVIIGTFVKVFLDKEEIQQDRSEIYYLLDSIAEVDRTTFIGADDNGNSVQELAAADTVVKKESFGFQSKTKASHGTKININTAGKDELMKLPGVGNKTADLILQYRANSKFRTPDDIMNIKGIGIKKFEKIKEYIIVE